MWWLYMLTVPLTQTFHRKTQCLYIVVRLSILKVEMMCSRSKTIFLFERCAYKLRLYILQCSVLYVDTYALWEMESGDLLSMLKLVLWSSIRTMIFLWSSIHGNSTPKYSPWGDGILWFSVPTLQRTTVTDLDLDEDNLRMFRPIPSTPWLQKALLIFRARDTAPEIGQSLNQNKVLDSMVTGFEVYGTVYRSLNMYCSLVECCQMSIWKNGCQTVCYRWNVRLI